MDPIGAGSGFDAASCCPGLYHRSRILGARRVSVQQQGGCDRAMSVGSHGEGP